MKSNRLAKVSLLALLSIGLTVGCASKQPVAEDAARPAVTDDGSAAAKKSIGTASSLYKEAVSMGAAWRDTGDMIKEAEALFADGKFAESKALADKAAQQSRVAMNQWYVEEARAIINRVKDRGLDGELKEKLAAVEAAIADRDGRRAYDLAKQLMAAIEAAAINYTVVRGDSLWKISGRENIYGNPYQWPLIYKKNSAQIKDADLIYPQQVLSIDKSPSAGDVSAAVRHARNRGAWSVGPVEASDRAYLGR
jgi:nucleoid-associated protein YgaU